MAEKLLNNRHAASEIYRKNARVYHVFSRKIYSAIGKEDIRNRRKHEFSYIETRLLALDFILTHQQHDYFETETDKVRYFCNQLRVPKEELPAKLYLSRKRTSITSRYFVDKFPMFLSHTGTPPVVSFTYVASGSESLCGFATHLHHYLALFRSLKRFNFLFLSPCEALFPKARRIFSSLIEEPLESSPLAEITRYFQIRKLWDTKQYAGLKHDDVLFCNSEMTSWDNTILGSMKIDEHSLVAEVNSEKRAKRLRDEIDARLGAASSHVSTVTQTLAEMLANAPEQNRAVAKSDEESVAEILRAPEVRRQIQERVQRDVEAWIHQKIPALGGRTPLQAVRNPDGREIVESLLLDWERRTEEGLYQPEIRPDFNAVRKLLNLPQASP